MIALLRGLLRFVCPPPPDREAEVREFFAADPGSMTAALRRCREALDARERRRL